MSVSSRKLAIRYLKACSDPDAQFKIYRLWKLLDDVDTASDIAKSDDDLFRALVEQYQRQRFDVVGDAEIDALYDAFHEQHDISPPLHTQEEAELSRQQDPYYQAVKVVMAQAKQAGWWAIKADAGYMGDGPADTMGAAVDDVVQQYVDEWGREPTMTELDAAWRFVTGPYRAGDPLVRTAAAKGKKKEVTNAEGKKVTIYQYTERQIANRHREKSERLDKLQASIGDLESKLKSDLKSDDPETQLTALAVALINHTYERVGNEGSASDGHFGVTGWLKKHVSFSGGDAKLSYVGKSGVKQNKSVTDPDLVKALKDLCEDKGDDDPLFDCDDCTVTSKEVNAYLKPFDVTAKDLRGYHANREMMERLADIRADGPELPRGRKERDEILKAEFKKALAATAQVVGHEAATLRSQYLVPHLEDTYMKDGSVIDSLRKKKANLRTASDSLARFVQATKTRAEREDEQVKDKLVRRSPKVKPPRDDLRDHRIDVDDDPDTETQGQEGDRDLSMNYKRVAALWLDLQGKSPTQRIASRYLYADVGPTKPKIPTIEEQQAGSVVTTGEGKLRAKNKAEFVKYFESSESEQAKTFSEGTERGEGGDSELDADAINKQWDSVSPEQREALEAHPAVPKVRELSDGVWGFDGQPISMAAVNYAMGALQDAMPEAKQAIADLAKDMDSLRSSVTSREQWQAGVGKLLDGFQTKMKAHLLKATKPTAPEQPSQPDDNAKEPDRPKTPDTSALTKAMADSDSRGISSAAKDLKEAHPELADELDKHLSAYQEANKAAIKASVAAETATSPRDKDARKAERDKALADRDAAVEAIKNVGKQEAKEPAPKDEAAPAAPVAPTPETPATDEGKPSPANVADAKQKMDTALKDLGMDKAQYDELTANLKVPEDKAVEFAQTVATKFKAMRDNPQPNDVALQMRGKVDPKASPEAQAEQLAINQYTEEYLLNPARMGSGFAKKGPIPAKELKEYGNEVYSDLAKLTPAEVNIVLTKAQKVLDDADPEKEDTPAVQQARKMMTAGYLAYLKGGGDPDAANLPQAVKDVKDVMPTNAAKLARLMGDRSPELMNLVDGDLLDSKTTEAVRDTYKAMSPSEAAEFHKDSNPNLAEAYRQLSGLSGKELEKAKAQLDTLAYCIDIDASLAAKGAMKEKDKKSKPKTRKRREDAPTSEKDVEDYTSSILDDVWPSDDSPFMKQRMADIANGKAPADPATVVFPKTIDRLDLLRKQLVEEGAYPKAPNIRRLDEIVKVMRAAHEAGNYDMLSQIKRVGEPPPPEKPRKVSDARSDTPITSAELAERRPGEIWQTANADQTVYGALSKDGETYDYFDSREDAQAWVKST